MINYGIHPYKSSGMSIWNNVESYISTDVKDIVGLGLPTTATHVECVLQRRNISVTICTHSNGYIAWIDNNMDDCVEGRRRTSRRSKNISVYQKLEGSPRTLMKRN